jgi:tRNA pseudouridine55 synthase
MSGWLVLVDKPPGPTSFDAVAVVRRASGEKRVGHTGTLDPFASGLLVLLGGRATKLSPFLLDHEKEYEGCLRLGVRTDTGDLEGRVVEERPVPAGLTPDDLRGAASRFVGRTSQVPPAYSAVKVGGERLYVRARRGEAVEARPREIEVSAFEITGAEIPRAWFRVRCGRGTYIRRLAEDLGAALGTCAHLESLRRTRVGPFAVEEAAGLAAVSALSREAFAELLRPAVEALPDWPRFVIGDAVARRVRDGRAPSALDVGAGRAAPHRACLLSADGTLVALVGGGESVAGTGTLRLLRVL